LRAGRKRGLLRDIRFAVNTNVIKARVQRFRVQVLAPEALDPGCCSHLLPI
jgi:hypothetical protein